MKLNIKNIINNPIIDIIIYKNKLKNHTTQTLQKKYLNTIIHTNNLPITLPHTLTKPSLLKQLLPKLDNIYLPNNPNNIQPHLYNKNNDKPDTDPKHNLLNITIINTTLEKHIPIFTIYRNLQKLIITTNNSLHRKLYEQPKLLKHRKNPKLPIKQQYTPSHKIQIKKKKLLSTLLPKYNNF